MDKITSTQIENIKAKDLLTRFDKINNRLDQLQKTVKTQPETELMTRKQVADLLEISLPTLWAWTKKEILIPYRIGNKIRYKKSEVLKSLQRISHKPL